MKPTGITTMTKSGSLGLGVVGNALGIVKPFEGGSYVLASFTN